MVYRGKPSTGCRNCRQRHIKCDETRPHCKACLRTGRSCPGYPHPFDVILRDQTAQVARTFTSTPSSPLDGDQSTSSKDEGHTIGGTSQGLSLSPTKPTLSDQIWLRSFAPANLCQPIEDTVLPLFFNAYLYLPKDPQIRNGFMEILPSMFSNAQAGSHLHSATLAVASFTVAAWTGQKSLLRVSEVYFTKALPRIREALEENKDADLETVIISILLLSIYEELVAMKDWGNPVKAHLRGAIALINSRQSRTLPEPISSTTYNAVQTQIIKTTRGLANPMVPTPKIWPLMQPVVPASPRMFLSSAASKLVRLRHDWENLRFNGGNQSDVREILQKAADIDNDLISWTHLIPKHWAPVPATIVPQPVRDAGLYCNRCDCFVDMWVASTWNSYRDCRMLVQSIILSCLRMMPLEDRNGSKISTAKATIQTLADDICATVPFLLGSQTESVRLKPGLVEYPYAETRPVTLAHKQSAPLTGAWHIITYLRNLQGPELGLPLQQVHWVGRQIDRVRMIYFQQ